MLPLKLHLEMDLKNNRLAVALRWFEPPSPQSSHSFRIKC